MKRALIPLLIGVFMLPVTLFFLSQNFSFAGPPPTSQPEFQTPEADRIVQAIRQAIADEEQAIPALILFETVIDHVRVSADGLWATAWLSPLDRQTGQIVPTEPGLVIVQQIDGQWRATLPSNPQWAPMARQAPADLLSDQQKTIWLRLAEISPQAVRAGPFSGYLLPWRGGETMALTQSVGHDRYTPSGNAHYAFDFAKPGYPSAMFDVYAARGGVVTRAVWSNPNGNENNANYMVLEDITTSPTTYVLYMHLAQDSIPPELRVIGAPVQQGQFIGVADDTGVSSGNHLHFHVHTNPTSYWGTSVDITFDDVTINGGRPRIASDLPYCDDSDVCDQTQTTYVSGNFQSPDHIPPIGGILAPLQGLTLTSSNLLLNGWASDESSGLGSAQFNANYNDAWQAIGSLFTSSPFAMDWDVCAAQVPDGPVSLALQIRDMAYNQAPGLPGLVHFTKNYACPPPPPACVPTSSQVALFAGPDFQGSCVVLNTGSYSSSSSLGALGDNNAASVQVGANVLATLFMDASLWGRSETLIASDGNLSDNRIGADSLSSLLVRARSTLPTAPTLVWPADGDVFPDNASLSLVWNDAGGGTQFQARLLQNSTQILSTPWQSEVVWHLDAPQTGDYTWQVKARNSSGESGWSSTRMLFVQASTPSSVPPVNVPFNDNFESMGTNWKNSSYWDLTNAFNHTPGGSISWSYDTSSGQGYDTGFPNAGYLTSPPVILPAGPVYYLRFYYRYETESPFTHWDQRWVQISVDAGAFTNLHQLSDDAPTYWLHSPFISLAAYAGHTIQIRFYFATLDDESNRYQGWYIDDFSITAAAPPNCGDANNTYTQAVQVTPGVPVNATICPAGDADFYKFQGAAGERVSARIEAQNLGSALDSYLFLLDVDGGSILAQNDDQVLYERTDSLITYLLSRTGTYYFKIRAWDHPSSGGNNYNYRLTFFKDNQDPQAAFTYPREGGAVPRAPIVLSVSASDAASGISHVQFLWHSSDWANSSWTILGEDWDGSDGWSYPFDVQQISDKSAFAFYAKVYDWAGNWMGIGVWNLHLPYYYLPLVIR